MADNHIENRHFLHEEDNIVDMRPHSMRLAEKLSKPSTYLIWAMPTIVLAVLIPSFGFLFGVAWLILTVIYSTNHYVLPVRYPMGTKDEKSRPGKGICYVGAVDSRSEFENFKEMWLSDDDMRKHILILGSTGSGKSEALKAIFFNSLSWSSGFFIADGKADNKLPTDVYTMCRSNGRDPDLLILNFLLAGKTPEQVRLSRRRRTNKLNPFPGADADTAIQMGANLLPKVEGDAKNWQEKALNFWRAVVTAIYYKRDKEGMEISVSTFLEYMALPKVEELYVEGSKEAQERDGDWSYGYVGIKNYLDSGCPAYRVEKLLKKHKLIGNAEAPAGRPVANAPNKSDKEFDQDNQAYEQHSYRTNQLMPVLNLLDKTYGFIFQGKYPEIDMTDVTLRNRVLVMLIPSLEKSASEAENLGKLAIACLRVMMGKNLGSEVEGSKRDLLDTKATNSPYPYVVALDELAYYFSDGIAVMFAQARSLGMSLIAAAQDIEKLTEGSRAPEAGAMIANTTLKFFMRIDDAGKTAELVQKIVGKARVGIRKTFSSAMGSSYKRESHVEVEYVDIVPTRKLQKFGQGEGVLNALGKTTFMKWFYMGKDIEKNHVDYFWINRFLQVAPASEEQILANSTNPHDVVDPYKQGQALLNKLKGIEPAEIEYSPDEIINAISHAAQTTSTYTSAVERGIVLYMAARKAVLERRAKEGLQPNQAPSAVGESLAVTTASNSTTGGISGQEHVKGSALTGAELDSLGFLDMDMPFARKPVQEMISPQQALDVLGLRQQDTVADLDVALTPLAITPPVPADDAMRFLGLGALGVMGLFDNQIGFKPIKDQLQSLQAAVPEHSPQAQAIAQEVQDRFLQNTDVLQRMERNAANAKTPSVQSISMRANMGVPAEHWVQQKDMFAHLAQLQASGAEDDWLTLGLQDVFNSKGDYHAFVQVDEVHALDPENTPTAVGFSQQTLDGVTSIEALMNHPAPQEAARAFEYSISRKVTPETQATASPESDEDLETLFKDWDAW